VEARAGDDSSTEYTIFNAPLSNGKGNRILCFAVFDENKTPSWHARQNAVLFV